MRIYTDMRRGAEEMKKVRGRLDVDQVDDVMDDIQEEVDASQKVRCWQFAAILRLMFSSGLVASQLHSIVGVPF